MARRRPRRLPSRNMPNNPKPRLTAQKPNAGRCVLPGRASFADVAAVLTVTVTVEALEPGVTEVGLTVQVANAGTPSQVRLIALEKVPPTGAIATE